MKYTELEKANEINRRIETLQDLRMACLKTYLTIIPIKRSRNNLAIQDGNSIIIAETDLNDVIRDYCDKRIAELNNELEAL